MDYQRTDINPDKGEYKGSCNITACQKPDAVWFNHGNQLYYCKSCAMRLNADPYNHRDAHKMFGHDLLTLKSPDENT